MNKVILITGANVGLGKESARQLALLPDTEKIYLACRNETKAIAAKQSLEEITGRSIFKVLLMDVSDPENVKQAVEKIEDSIDALIMNAGGIGGRTPFHKVKNGMSTMAATNLIGHVVLVDELISRGKLNNVAMYAGSEAARGIKKMNVKQPELKNGTTQEFVEILKGDYFKKKDPMESYAFVKYAAALWMGSLARKHSEIRFITMSPGGTSGTAAMDEIPLPMRIMYKYIMMPIVMPLLGMIHKLEDGARRYVKAVSDNTLRSGAFYASEQNVLVGPVVDQSNIFPALSNTQHQDNVSEALHRFI